jgi:hypothetical protein
MPTELRHDIDYLKRLLTEAIRLHRPNSIEEATLLADIRDYIMYLALDAVGDQNLAETLLVRFTQMGRALEEKLKETPVWQDDERQAIRFYVGFLFALEQLLSLKHEIGLPGEKISREDFKRSWRRTASKLGLSP